MKALIRKGKSVFVQRYSQLDKLKYLLKSKHISSKLFNIALSKTNSKLKYTGKLPYFPTQILIEPTTQCNYRCLSCSHGMPEGKARLAERDRYMDFDKYKEFIDSVCHKTWYLSLTGCGESFLHPNIYEMIDYAYEKGLFVTLETNGSVFDPEKLAEAKISVLHFALDCITPESYSKYRIGGSIDNVIRRMTAFCELNAKKENPVEIQMRFLLNSYSELDYEKALELFDHYDFVTIYKGGFMIPPENYQMLSTMPITTTVEKYEEWKTTRFPEYDLYKLDPKTGLMRDKTLFNDFTGNCPSALSGAFINSDGEMFPCCAVQPYAPVSMSFGNVFKDGFSGVWNSEKAVKFRSKFKKTKGDYAFCKNCPSSRI